MDHDTTLAPGSLVDGRYLLVDLLGEGTFAGVWRAQDLRLSGRAVAVKFLKPEFFEHGEAVARFEAEADALAQVQHPHVVAVHDRGTWEGRRFLVTEVVDGHALDAWLDEHRSSSALPPLDVVRRLFGQVCAGIGAAHAVHAPGPIVHRDIKPENVLLRAMPDGALFVKVVDFGIAQLGRRDNTRTGARMGTFLYMPPEQALGNSAAVGPWSDVFSLGVLLVEMLTLRSQPDETEPWWGVALRRDNDLLATLTAMRNDVPPAVWRLVALALSSDVAQRPQDANALRTQFRACWSEASRPAPPPADVAPPPAAPPRVVPTPALPPPLTTAAPRARAPLIVGVVATGVAAALGAHALRPRAPQPVVATRTTAAPLRSAEPPVTFVPSHAPVIAAPVVAAPAPAEFRLAVARSEGTLAPVPVASDAALAGFLDRWSRALADDASLAPYYVGAVQFRRSGGLASADAVRRYYETHVRNAGTFAVDWSRSTWTRESPDAPDVARACARVPGADGDVIKVRAWAVETAADRDRGTGGEVPCDHLEGVYLLRVRRVAGAPHICHETWSLREGICASCPAARACRVAEP